MRDILKYLLCALVVLSGLALLFGEPDKPYINFNNCWSGVNVTLVFHNTVDLDVQHLEWGPPEFRMTATYIAWPGGTFGWLKNSRGVCTIEDAKRLGGKTK